MSGRAAAPAPLELLQWPRDARLREECATPLDRARPLRSDAVFAASILSGALALVYAFAGVTILGAVPRSGAVLLTIAAAQAWLAVGIRRSKGRRAIAGVAVGEMLLALAWLASRSVGLPFLNVVHPVDVLGSLVAIDEVLLAVLFAGIASGIRSPSRVVEAALVLAAISMTALASGHMHGAASARAGAGAQGLAEHFYCRLL